MFCIENRYCLQCGKVIENNGQSNSAYMKRKFCNNSCAALYNNVRKKKKVKSCRYCGRQISPRNVYCSIECKHNYEYEQYIKQWKDGILDGTIGDLWISISGHIRRYIFEKYHNRCAKCGWSEINPFTGTVPLEIDHIDGDAKNNKEENLILLCPNCHSLTKTYRGANKGKGSRNIKWTARN